MCLSIPIELYPKKELILLDRKVNFKNYVTSQSYSVQTWKNHIYQKYVKYVVLGEEHLL